MRRALWPDVADDMHALEMAEQLSGHHAVLVHDGGERLSGFVELSVRSRVDGSRSERVGYVEGWWVEPEHRGRGVGRTLIEAAERWAREQGLTELASDAELDDEDAIRAHRALGFRETFRLVHFLKPVR